MTDTRWFVGALALLCSCSPSSMVPPVSSGELRRQEVRLPGVEFLALGASLDETLASLRGHGVQCKADRSEALRMGCSSPQAGQIMLHFEGSRLAGVQVQQPQTAAASVQALQSSWTLAYGVPVQRIKRPGIVAARHPLRDGSALFMIYNEEEKILILEQVSL